MAQAIRFSEFGGPDVLEVVEVDIPAPGPGEVVVDVVAAGLNPVESAIRSGVHSEKWPVEFPERQGRDLAGIVAAVGPGVTEFTVNDSVMGFVRRGSHATQVIAPASQLLKKPQGVPWEVAGGLYVAGTTAWAAVESLKLGEGDIVVITSAAGGLGCLAAQLATRRGAIVIGTCVPERFDFVRQLGIKPVGYEEDLVARVREIADGRGVSAVIDFLGRGDAVGAVELGIPASRVVTVIDWDAVEDYGVTRVPAGDTGTLAKVAQLIHTHQIRLPIADVFPLEHAREAFATLDRREAPGKIVFGMHPVDYPGQRMRNVDMKEQEETLGRATPHERRGVYEKLPPVIGGRGERTGDSDEGRSQPPSQS